MTEIIKTESLTKSFGKTLAVDSVSLRVREGEIYGFLGLNGAGKTTTIRMLLGMIEPTSGHASLFGNKLGSSGINWNEVGYMVEGPSAYPDLSVYENLDVFRKYRGIKGKSSVDSILEQLRLKKYEHVKAKELSMGNLQRLGLAKAFLHQPKLLLLDEPINGLDPAGIVEIRSMLKELANQGSTILISSHILSEISLLATTIGIVHEGKLLKELSATELDQQLTRKLIVDTPDNFQASWHLDQRGIAATMDTNGHLEISDKEVITNSEQVSLLLAMEGLPPRQIFIHEENLEEYFLKLIKTD